MWRSRRRLFCWFLALAGVLAAIGTGAVFHNARSHADPDKLWTEAERTFLSGRWDEAAALLARLERLRTRTGLDWVLKAQIATAKERFPEALQALAQVADTHAIAPQSRLMAGRLHRQLRHLRQAEAEFRAALGLKPGLIEAHKELIYILGLQSRRHEVDAEFHELARLTRLTEHDLSTWALTHFTRWNPDIVADLDGCIQADPLDRYSRLAVVELVLERPEVDDYINRILEPLPQSDTDALALKIDRAFKRGRFAEAESLLAAAPPDHARIARLRGEMALRRHDLDAAIRSFEQALGNEPYDRVAPMRLALALQLKGDKRAADIYLERLKRLNRVYTLITASHSNQSRQKTSDLAELGEACEHAGLNDEARGWYMLAITARPLDPFAQAGLYRVGRASPAQSEIARGTPPAR
jgi:tetratricopeptide (TPR) repeat protein